MLAGGEKSRVDTRMTAMLPARMRDERGMRDVRVGDLSSTGLLLVCDRPPARGEIADINIGGHNIVGEVRWVSGRRCGLRSRSRIDVQSIIAGRPPKQRFKAKRIEPKNDPAEWTPKQIMLGYGTLAACAFASAYLIANIFFL